MAARLRGAQRPVILLGTGALHHPDAAAIRGHAARLAEACGARLGLLGDGGNAAGAWLAGCVPHRGPGGRRETRSGRNAQEMIASPLGAYLLFGIEPSLDCADAAAAGAAMAAARRVIAFTAFDSPRLREQTDLMLPIGLFPETAGTFVNFEGRWQSETGAVAPPGDARPGWKVLRVLANLLDVDGFDYVDVSEVRAEVEALCSEARVSASGQWSVPPGGAGDVRLRRLGDVPVHCVDALVRRAQPLQDTADARFRGAVLPADLAQQLGVVDGDAVRVRQGSVEVQLNAEVDPSLASGCVMVAAGVAQTSTLGPMFGEIQVSKA
jgi:NADH-quinone oxidoreductase subunit G